MNEMHVGERGTNELNYFSHQRQMMIMYCDRGADYHCNGNYIT